MQLKYTPAELAVSPALLAQARATWTGKGQREALAATRHSKLRVEVSRMMSNIGVSHGEPEVTEDGLFAVAIRLTGWF